MTDTARPWARRLRVERARRGWSRGTLATRIEMAARDLHLTGLPRWAVLRGYSHKWESGEDLPGWRYQVLLASVYGVGVRTLFGDAVALDIPPVFDGENGGTVELPHYARAEDERMQRRAFVVWLGALAAGTTALPEPVRKMIQRSGDQSDLLPAITMDDVAALDAANRMYADWEHSVGGGMSRRVVVSHLCWAVDHFEAGVRGTPEALDAWRVTTARLADTAGSMSHDAGCEQQARALLVLGYQIASAVQDDPRAEPQRAQMLSDLARHAIDTGRPETGLELVRQAQGIADTGAPAVTRSKLHAVKARAYGALGDSRAVERELGLAEEEFTRRNPDDLVLEPWLSCWYQEAQVHFNNGTARLALLRSNPESMTSQSVDRIAEDFDQSAARWDEGERKAATRASLQAASTVMSAGDPERAVDLAREAVTALPGLRSKRTRDDAHDLKRAAAPYRRRADVDALVHDLVAATG